jgi:hypothetical protein
MVGARVFIIVMTNGRDYIVDKVTPFLNPPFDVTEAEDLLYALLNIDKPVTLDVKEPKRMQTVINPAHVSSVRKV